MTMNRLLNTINAIKYFIEDVGQQMFIVHKFMNK